MNRTLMTRGPLGKLLCVALFCAGLAYFGGSASAQSFGGPKTLVVGSDRGGPVAERAQQIEVLRRSHTKVAITGRVCYSACTMFLGAEDVCVSPTTLFGFHGPTKRNGEPLPQRQFEHFSRLMARYYPVGLQDWFLATGRYKTAGVYRLRGSDLVAMGIASCPT